MSIFIQYVVLCIYYKCYNFNFFFLWQRICYSFKPYCYMKDYLGYGLPEKKGLLKTCLIKEKKSLSLKTSLKCATAAQQLKCYLWRTGYYCICRAIIYGNKPYITI